MAKNKNLNTKISAIKDKLQKKAANKIEAYENANQNFIKMLQQT